MTVALKVPAPCAMDVMTALKIVFKILRRKILFNGPRCTWREDFNSWILLNKKNIPELQNIHEKRKKWFDQGILAILASIR